VVSIHITADHQKSIVKIHQHQHQEQWIDKELRWVSKINSFEGKYKITNLILFRY
jgi:hypothetical protein